MGGSRRTAATTGPREVTATPEGELYAVLPDGELVRSTDTGANWMNIGKAGSTVDAGRAVESVGA